MLIKTVTIWEQATYVVMVPDELADIKEAAMKATNQVGLVGRVTGAEAGFNPPITAIKRVAETSLADLEAAKAVLPEAHPS